MKPMKQLLLLLLLLQGVVHAQISVTVPPCANCPGTASSGFGGLGAGCLTGDGTIKIAGTDGHYTSSLAWSTDNRIFTWDRNYDSPNLLYSMIELPKVPAGFEIKKARLSGNGFGKTNAVTVLGKDGRFIITNLTNTDTQTFLDVAGKLGGSTGIQDFAQGFLQATIFVVTNEGDAYVGPNSVNYPDALSYDVAAPNTSATAWTKVPRIPNTKYTRVWTTSHSHQVFYETQNLTTGAYEYYSAGLNEYGLLTTTDARILTFNSSTYSTIAYTSIPAQMDKLPARTSSNGKIEEFYTKSDDGGPADNAIHSIMYRVGTNEVYYQGVIASSLIGIGAGPDIFSSALDAYDANTSVLAI